MSGCGLQVDEYATLARGVTTGALVGNGRDDAGAGAGAGGGCCLLVAGGLLAGCCCCCCWVLLAAWEGGDDDRVVGKQLTILCAPPGAGSSLYLRLTSGACDCDIVIITVTSVVSRNRLARPARFGRGCGWDAVAQPA